MRSHEASGKGDRKFSGVHPFGGTSIVAYGVGLRNRGESRTKQGVRPFGWISRLTSKLRIRKKGISRTKIMMEEKKKKCWSIRDGLYE